MKDLSGGKKNSSKGNLSRVVSRWFMKRKFLGRFSPKALARGGMPSLKELNEDSLQDPFKRRVFVGILSSSRERETGGSGGKLPSWKEEASERKFPSRKGKKLAETTGGGESGVRLFVKGSSQEGGLHESRAGGVQKVRVSNYL